MRPDMIEAAEHSDTGAVHRLLATTFDDIGYGTLDSTDAKLAIGNLLRETHRHARRH